MKKFDNIVMSSIEPDTNCIWLKEGKLYYYEGGWKPCAADFSQNKGLATDLNMALADSRFLLGPDGGVDLTGKDTINGSQGRFNIEKFAYGLDFKPSNNPSQIGYNIITPERRSYVSLFKHFYLNMRIPLKVGDIVHTLTAPVLFYLDRDALVNMPRAVVGGLPAVTETYSSDEVNINGIPYIFNMSFPKLNTLTYYKKEDLLE